MNSKHKYVVTMAAALSMALAIAAPAMAQDTPTPAPAMVEVTPTLPPLTASTELYATSNYLVNVRSGPGLEYTVIGKTRQGDAVDITGKTANESWLRVNFNGQEGWVSAPLFDVTGDLMTTSEAVAGEGAVLRSSLTPVAVSEADQMADVIGSTVGNVNLRALPSTSSDVLVIIPFGTELTATGRVAANNWVQVTYEGQTGWVSSGTLFFSRGVLANLPVFDETGNAVPATPQPTIEPTAEATASQ